MPATRLDVGIVDWQKPHLQHAITVTAVNLLRIVDWQMGEPLPQTRTSRFAVAAFANSITESYLHCGSGGSCLF